MQITLKEAADLVGGTHHGPDHMVLRGRDEFRSIRLRESLSQHTSATASLAGHSFVTSNPNSAWRRTIYCWLGMIGRRTTGAPKPPAGKHCT